MKGKKKKDGVLKQRRHQLRQADDFDEMMDLENEANLKVLSGLRIRPKNKWNHRKGENNE